ncbi:hypothetical protein BDZ97DRAFT_1755837 [Flammula alnicola]|nr:hypothetical protein BDZ97DRAFT_1755837 [Flammula alnicola]
MTKFDEVERGTEERSSELTNQTQRAIYAQSTSGSTRNLSRNLGKNGYLAGSDHPSSTIAEAPFNDPKADFILRSSDGISFYVYRLLLSLVSPIFEGMFTLPGQAPQELYDGRPCISITDDSKKVYQLLSWCDPRCTEVSLAFADIQLVLEMADKYGMDSVVKRVEVILLSARNIIESEPLVVYAVAIRHRCDGLARVAAKETLRIPLNKSPPIPEMKHVSGFALQNLIRYHYECANFATSMAKDFSWIDLDNTPGLAHFTEGCSEDNEICPMESREDSDWLSWWLKYMETCADRLDKRPTATVVQDPELLAMINADNISDGDCENCKANGYDALISFSKFFANEIEKILSEVEFKVEY